MTITPELIAQFNLIHVGGVYYGAFAKDESDHAAIVAAIHYDFVHYFSITSSKVFIDSRKLFDPKAVVELEESEKRLFFPDNPKDDWIYCGSANWQIKSLDDFKHDLEKGVIRVLSNAPDSLFERVIKAIKESITYSDDELRKMGIISSLKK